ncbi:MAG: nucleotide pyrophosphohydrolase [Caldilineaceae bacterium]
MLQDTLDQSITLADLRAAVHAFVAARAWYQFHTPKNLAMSIAIEAAELMEHFQWRTPEESQALMADTAARAEVADELADVLIYCLSFANSAGIDVSHAIHTKLARNESRFPVPSGEE